MLKRFYRWFFRIDEDTNLQEPGRTARPSPVVPAPPEPVEKHVHPELNQESQVKRGNLLELGARLEETAKLLETTVEELSFVVSRDIFHYVHYRKLKFDKRLPERPSFASFLPFGLSETISGSEPQRQPTGYRKISAPKPRLKAVQKRILRCILDEHALHERCHGFVKGRSVRTAVEPHTGKKILVTADIKKFFPTIRAYRVDGLFRSLGFSPETSRVLMRLTTWNGSLPQGAPSSPAISNLICRKLDSRLNGLAGKAGAEYTRYADDMAFSGGRTFRRNLPWFLPLMRRIVKEEGFVLPKRNICVRGSGARQKLLGVVVNSEPNIPRAERRRLRAVLHQAKKNGAFRSPAEENRIRGIISWLNSINPRSAEKLATSAKSVGS